MLYLFCLLVTALSLYEEQAGQFDWHRDQIGHVKIAQFYEKARTRHVHVGTAAGVVAAISSKSGTIAWKQVLPEQNVDFLMNYDEYLLSLSTDDLSQTWRMWSVKDGAFAWEMSTYSRAADPYPHLTTTNKLLRKVAGDQPQAIADAVFVTSKKNDAIRLYLLSGNQVHAVHFSRFPDEASDLWSWTPSDGVTLQKLFWHNKKLTVLGLTKANAIVSFTVQQGEVTSESTVASCSSTPSLLVLENGVWVALDKRASTVYVSTGNSEATATQLQSIISGGSLDGLQLESLDRPSSFALKTASQSCIMSVAGDGVVTISRSIPTVQSFAHTQLSGDRYIARASVNQGVLEFTVEGETGASIAAGTIDIGERRGIDSIFLSVFRRGEDKAVGYRLLVATLDQSLLLIQRKSSVDTLVWVREESLASIAQSEFFALPADSLYSDGGSGFPSFFARVGPQLEHAAKSLADPMSFLSVDIPAKAKSDLEREDPSVLHMDYFGFRKLVIATTECGKVVALNTETGRIVWTHLLPSGERPTSLIHLGHGSGLIISQSASSTSFHRFTVVNGDFTQTHALDYTLQGVFPTKHVDENRAPIILLVGSDQQVSVYPDSPSARSIVAEHSESMFYHLVKLGDHHSIHGYRLISSSKGLLSEEVWSIAFPGTTEKIAAVAPPQREEHMKSTVRETGGGAGYLVKYINPNLLAVATVRTLPTGGKQTVGGIKRTTDPSVTVYLIDTVIGKVVDKIVHKYAHGPVHMVQSENFVAYHYFDVDSYRYQMSVLEMHEEPEEEVLHPALAKNEPKEKFFSAHTAKPPVVTQQSYVFHTGVQAMGISNTAQGITQKEVLVGLNSDQLMGISRQLLDPRRPYEDPTPLDVAERLVPYMRELPMDLKRIVSYNKTLSRMSSIKSSPTLLESTSLVFVHGLDVFFTRITPSDTFDRLSAEFNQPFLVLTVSGVGCLVFFSQLFANRKRLRQQWS